MAKEQQIEARQRNLLRFVHAQDSGGIYDGTGTYSQALQEVRAGHKRGHWIWYVFPWTIIGLILSFGFFFLVGIFRSCS